MLAIVSLVVGGPPLRLGRGMGGNHARNNHLSGINFPCGFELVRTNHKATRRCHPACALRRRPYKDPLACWPLFLWWTPSPGKGDGGNHARNNHKSGINFPCGFELVRINHKDEARTSGVCNHGD